MAAFSTIAAVAGLAISAGGMYMQNQQAQQANRLQQQAADEQRKARSEEAAQQRAAFEQERRQQVRDERIRRGKILNASANTNTSVSSGMEGALGSMSTQLGANLGSNQAAYMSGQRINLFRQNAADFNAEAQTAANRAQMWGQVGGIGRSIFGAGGGMSSLTSAWGSATGNTAVGTDQLTPFLQARNNYGT